MNKERLNPSGRVQPFTRREITTVDGAPYQFSRIDRGRRRVFLVCSLGADKRSAQRRKSSATFLPSGPKPF